MEHFIFTGLQGGLLQKLEEFHDVKKDAKRPKVLSSADKGQLPYLKISFASSPLFPLFSPIFTGISPNRPLKFAK